MPFGPHHERHDDRLLQVIAEGCDRITEAVNELTRVIKKASKPAKELPHFNYSVEVQLKKGNNMPLELAFSTEQQVNVTLHPVTAKGKAVAVDGVPVWSVSVGSVTLQPAQDGLSCVIVSADTPGQSEVLVSADADLGAGVTTISDTISCVVGDPQATSLGLTADAPTTKP